MVQPTHLSYPGKETEPSFASDLNKFIKNNTPLIIGTLGIALAVNAIGNLLGRVVTFINKCFGITEKVDSLKAKIFNHSSINGKNSTPAIKIPYEKIPTSLELKKIEHIMTSTGSCSLTTIILRSSELNQMGADLESIHPLRYLSSILTNPKLKNELIKTKAKEQTFLENRVWKKTFEGHVDKLNRHAEQDNLLCYIDQFAKDLNLDSSNLTTLVKDKRWKEFFDTLLEKS